MKHLVCLSLFFFIISCSNSNKMNQITKPIAKKEIRAARANLVSIARKMVSDGEFSMDDIFGQEELE